MVVERTKKAKIFSSNNISDTSLIFVDIGDIDEYGNNFPLIIVVDAVVDDVGDVDDDDVDDVDDDVVDANNVDENG
ncbi:hypothetical protein DERP_014419 [Dermatophagoides pteronyssinus]|uniref:Uncharacterized protein n=1 Tax=Dermatophagoides pteronyssinus TaxID=6956 RepID=A0ABQ8J6H5_DERPT|nr:hypothetical protein DERP_014419 [Dermatophagoides pteronyssinus]